jgi:two-component system KDP operon response regulator KdpE
MQRKSIKVLITDDEPDMRRGLAASLSTHGYEIAEARSGEEAVSGACENPPDVVLLDINMPGMGGIEACRRIRAACPAACILMITVRDGEEDTVQALNAGADDYVVKPFRSRELSARIAAVLRRSHPEPTQPDSTIRAGKLELDVPRRQLRKAGEEIHLSPIEFNLLQYLMENPEVPLEHTRLLRAIWGPEYGNELEYLRTYIRLLRRKIEDDPTRPEYITTEPWLGYRFRSAIEQTARQLLG